MDSTRLFFTEYPSFHFLYRNCFLSFSVRRRTSVRLPAKSGKFHSRRDASASGHGREICWFLARIPFYLEKDCAMPEAIDFAIDDCLMEGILYSTFMHRREEIKENLVRSLRNSACRCTHE